VAQKIQAEYEIDLNAKHAEALRKSLAKYIDAARRSSGMARRPARSGRSTSGRSGREGARPVSPSYSRDASSATTTTSAHCRPTLLLTLVAAGDTFLAHRTWAAKGPRQPSAPDSLTDGIPGAGRGPLDPPAGPARRRGRPPGSAGDHSRTRPGR